LLFEISQMLVGRNDLRDIIKPLLKKLCLTIGALRGTINIINRETSRIFIRESIDLGSPGGGDYQQKIPEGFVDQVIQSGKPSVFTIDGGTKAGQGASVAFYCLPIYYGEAICGTLSIETVLCRGENADDGLRLLSLVSFSLGQAAYFKQQAQERIESLQRENERLQEQIKNNFKPDNMVGSSRDMHTVYLHIEQVCSSPNTTVLIRGESGVGKELVASAIHNGSSRRGQAFVKINCAALPDSIIESELFGHEKGAFTGAISMRKGRFEIADGGTIFLDEIGDLLPQTQVKLLRVLQEREFERIGGYTPIRCNVRVIAATSRNLEQLIEEGKFRLDLYYRLNVFPIYVPPLRARKSDILQLVDYFVEKYARLTNKKFHRIAPDAVDLILSYGWPGNVRELENCIERAVLICNDDTIHAHHLPPTLQAAEPAAGQPGGLLENAVNSLERDMIVNALRTSHGKMAAAARVLGITERMITLRVKKFDIDTDVYRRKGRVLAGNLHDSRA
jgi:Nif-specific regulatory protein